MTGDLRRGRKVPCFLPVRKGGAARLLAQIAQQQEGQLDLGDHHGIAELAAHDLLNPLQPAGGVANAVGYGLRTKNDLGSHTELMSDSIMELMKLGVVNNRRKQFMPGKTVASFTFGSRELYRFVDRNPDMYYMPFPIVNDPVNIAKNDNMISINTALSIDLFGQVDADNLAGKQYSATGGQLDFVRGAQMSRGGKSFIAVTSSFADRSGQRRSRIVLQFPAGTAVTTPRSDVQYIVTEYGCVNLKPLTMRERVRAMITLAHPQFRAELTEQARAHKML